VSRVSRWCGLVAFVLGAAACGKRVPDEIKPTLDAIRPDARKVASAAAAACSAQFASGRFTVTKSGCRANKLPGEDIVPTVPSPAKGTSLESNPGVLDVEVTCYAPTRPTEACGMGLGSLHNAISPPGANRTRNVAEGNCKTNATDCEEVIVPSQSALDERSTDLRIVKPVAGGPAGATVEVTVILAKK
jgi:hypothetical protein